ncbi:MAG: choice-of-anchor M domain-containing protein [Limisphaerales bacterium]
MKTCSLLLAAGLLAPVTPTLAAVISDGHQDIRFNYAAATGWSTAVYDHDTDIAHPPGDVVFDVSSGAELTRPAGSQWDFTGAAAGATIWVLPQVQDTSLPWLGTSTEQTAAGGAVFVSNNMKLTLTGYSGPGAFSLFTVSPFGVPTALMATADGLSDADAINTKANAHAHYNWVFTEPGNYSLILQASGALVPALGGGLTSSDPFSVNFTVVPEPGAYAAIFGLLALGAGWLKHRRRRG